MEEVSNKTIRILLVDGQELVRYGLGRMLEQEEDMQVVGECATVEEAVFQLGELLPDVLLMDLNAGGVNVLEVARCLKESGLACGAGVIILADTADCRDEVLEAGAAGYILRGATRTEVTRIVREAFWSERSRNGDSDITEEIELVIPALPEAEAAQMLRFLCQLEEILDDNYDSIVRVTGSWDEGATVTLALKPGVLTGFLDKLASMPNIKAVEEEPLVKRTISSLASRFGVLLKSGNNPGRRIRITLKKTGAARRGLPTMLN